MTSDPNKKTTRTFQCREALWQKFEQMARELECSVDYLINDSMKQYARQRGYGAAASAGHNSIPPPMVSAAPPSSGPVAPSLAPTPLPPPRSIPPPPGGARPVPPPIPNAAASQPSGTLTITYQGEVFQVTKDRFIIGRGKQTSDLTIKDPNVSRQHAMIEFLTGQYY